MYEEAHIKQIANSIQSSALLLDEEFSEEAKLKCGLVFQSFIESLDNLHIRYIKVMEAENAFDAVSQNEESYYECQSALVGITEAFHQHVYAVLGRFAMLLNHFAPKTFKAKLPTRSISKMLDFLEGKVETEINLGFDLIRQSLEFRNKFVDHPQQNKAHDWMTYRIPESALAIIYYIPGNNTRTLSKSSFNPYDPSFEPPVPCESFYVSPSAEKVYGSLLTLFLTFGSQLDELI